MTNKAVFMQSVLDPIPSSSNFELQKTTDLQMKFKFRRVFCNSVFALARILTS